MAWLSIIAASDPRASNAINLRRLFTLRNIAIPGQIITVLVVMLWLELPLPFFALGSVIGMQVVVNILTGWRLTRSGEVSEAGLFAHLLFDAGALTAMLYLTGGSTNPFVLLYLLPITLTAAALPGRYAWIMVGVTVACYTLLMYRYIPLGVAHSGHGDHGSAFDLHVFGMWCGFVLCAILIAHFAVRMSATLRERDHALAALHAQALENDRVIALGALAAGAAHEFGTPLATMAVLVGEMSREAEDERLAILREQIDRCKRILTSLSASAGDARAEGVRRLVFDEYLAQLLADWRRLRPAATASLVCEGVRPAPEIAVEETLTQALLSILNNAADAAPDGIEMIGRWDEAALSVAICDRGPGIAPVVAEQAGRAIFSTKTPTQGMGLGLYLAHAAIGRLGGQVRLSNRESGGARVEVLLPLERLGVGA
jgi:two-component system sensor histidine kinase RegB